MHIHLLGTGAGGGFPQWNCNCHNCKRLREGTIKSTARTQSSITVSSNGEDWVLFNASPDIRAQIESFPPLQPARKVRDTGICSIILCDGQIDHSTGMLILREHDKPWDVYCTAAVYEDMTTGYPIFNILGHFRGVNWHEVGTDQKPFTIPKADNLIFTAVPLKSEAPPYSPHRHNTVPGDNVGYKVEDTTTGKNLFYAPGLGIIEDHVYEYMKNADVVLVDGTVWTNDEMSRHGIKDILSSLDKPRKILIHINNTNPILDEESDERKQLDDLGIEVSFDGMDIHI